MFNYDNYAFILCVVVFSIFVILFSYLIGSCVSSELKLIRHGHLDYQIRKQQRKKDSRNTGLASFGKVLSFIFCLLFVVLFLFSLYLNKTEDKAANGIPSIKVVKSESMSYVNEENDYLKGKDVTNQIQLFDIIICHHLPPEDELELYDIVVYKYDDMYIIHRIVGIEEPNDNHPNERHFLLQGDANENADKFPVLYSQMQGIYKGDRIPFVGSFVMFLQSPAGILCIILVLFATFISPIIEYKVDMASKMRLARLQQKEKQDN